MAAIRSIGLLRARCAPLRRAVPSPFLRPTVASRLFSSDDQVKVTIREALNSALDDELARDDKVFLVGEEVGQYQGAYKVTRNLLGKYGANRVLDTPITEAGFCGIAVGSAFAGLRPCLEFMTWNFAMQAIDHIINNAAKTLYMSNGTIQCPITIRGPNGSAAGVGAQHSQDYSSWYANIPGIKVVSPYDIEDCRGLLKSSIRDPNPVVFLENELMYSVQFDLSQEEHKRVMDKDFTVPIGKAKVMREGTDITIVTFSRMTGIVLKAAEQLQEQYGVNAEVINLRTIRPLDTETIIQSVLKTHSVLSVDETWPVCGIGSEICALVCETPTFYYLDAPFGRLTAADCPLPYTESLEAACLPRVPDIVNKVLRMKNIQPHQQEESS